MSTQSKDEKQSIPEQVAALLEKVSPEMAKRMIEAMLAVFENGDDGEQERGRGERDEEARDREQDRALARMGGDLRQTFALGCGDVNAAKRYLDDKKRAQ